MGTVLAVVHDGELPTISEYGEKSECAKDARLLDLGVLALHAHRGGRTHLRSRVDGPGVQGPGFKRKPKPQVKEPFWVPKRSAPMTK